MQERNRPVCEVGEKPIHSVYKVELVQLFGEVRIFLMQAVGAHRPGVDMETIVVGPLNQLGVGLDVHLIRANAIGKGGDLLQAFLSYRQLLRPEDRSLPPGYIEASEDTD